jgi:hypothetical protein
MTELPFDRLVIVVDGVDHPTSIANFLALPLPERVSLILQRRLKFFKGNTPVDRSIGLKSLADSSTPSRDR